MIAKDWTVNGTRYRIHANVVTVDPEGGTSTDHDARIACMSQADDYTLSAKLAPNRDVWDEVGEHFYPTIESAIEAANRDAGGV